MRKKEIFATEVKNLAICRLGSVLYDVEKIFTDEGVYQNTMYKIFTRFKRLSSEMSKCNENCHATG
jgi:hypothetical protein